MPEISRFYGIVITMYYEITRHRFPHFHARYNRYQATFSIDPPALLAGVMPRRQQSLILAWAEIHQEELLTNWQLMTQGRAMDDIEGLR